MKAHEQAVYQVAFSTDGSTLATASTDKTAKLWNWQEAKPKEKAKLAGHGDAVWAVTFAKDGRIATASADRTIKVWDAAGKELTTLRGHKDWVSNIAFSPDGKTLASTSHDRTMRMWNLELAMKLADQVKQTATKLSTNKEAAQKAADGLTPAQTEADKAKSRAEAITAVLDARKLPNELKQIQAAVVLAGKNRFLTKSATEAKAALDAATKAAAEKTKAFAGDKEFSAKLKKVKEGPVADADKEKAAADKASADAAAKIKSLTATKAAAEKAITEAKAKAQELADQQAKTIEGYKSSVWGVAFSADGKLVATGSHKDSLRVFETAGEFKELYPSPVEEEEEEEEEEEAEAEEE